VAAQRGGQGGLHRCIRGLLGLNPRELGLTRVGSCAAVTLWMSAVGWGLGADYLERSMFFLGCHLCERVAQESHGLDRRESETLLFHG
jgi:hypothetical protein